MSIQEQKVRKQQVQSQINKLEKQLTDLLTGETQTKLKVDNLENELNNLL